VRCVSEERTPLFSPRVVSKTVCTEIIQGKKEKAVSKSGIASIIPVRLRIMEQLMVTIDQDLHFVLEKGNKRRLGFHEILEPHPEINSEIKIEGTYG
jgi:hypothetical protein